MNPLFTQSIAILALALLATTSQAQEGDSIVTPTTGKCVFTDQELTLAQAIQTGRAKPVDVARTAGRLSLTIPEMNQWTIASRRLESLWVLDVRSSIDAKPWPVFVAVFDGTWNDKEDPDLPRTVPAQLADDLAALAQTDPLVLPHYYEGVGTRESVPLKLWDGATGRGTIERAERALLDLKAATSANGGVVPYVYAIGFSRGAASARHFLNLVDSLASPSAPIKSSALLFDTVATGQIDHLELGIPASNDLTVQIVATREYRFAFPYVPVQTDATDHSSEANGNDDKVVEVHVPGAHSDIGGGYDEGLWKFTLAMSRALLTRQGLATAGGASASEDQAILNMGRHDSDWVKSRINGDAHSRSSVAIKSKIRPRASVEKSVDDHMDRSVRAHRALERSLQLGKPSRLFANQLQLGIDRKGDAYEITHNCQTHTFTVDVQAHAITLDGRLFQHLSESRWQNLNTSDGLILVFERQNPANWTLDAVCSDAHTATPGC